LVHVTAIVPDAPLAVTLVGAEGIQLTMTSDVESLQTPTPTAELAATRQMKVFETFEAVDPLPSIKEVAKKLKPVVAVGDPFVRTVNQFNELGTLH